MRTSRLISAFSVFLLAACSVIAQEKQYPQYNCAITPPAGWNQLTNLPPQQAFCVAFANNKKTRVLMLIIDDKHKPADEVNDRFVTEFEKGVESSGAGRRVSGKIVDVAGVKGYERLGQAQVNGKPTSTIMRVVPADGRFYSVQAMLFDGDAGEDAEIHEALGTFRFMTPPSPPPNRSDRTAYLAGKYIGVGVVIAVVAAIKAVKRQQSPPPLPPNPQP